jgi:hypothetical protein
LYRLPELLKYPDGTVFVCEGEKDSDNVAALGQWTGGPPAQALYGTAQTVRVVLLPGLLDGGDVSDWLDAGGTIEKLIEISFDTPVWEPTSPPPQPSSAPATTDSRVEEIAEDGVTDTPAPPAKKSQAKLPPLPFINMSRWDDEEPPPREWAVHERIPLRQVTLFSGEGAAGKSTVQLHECAAHTVARDWLGSLPMPGPAIFVDAEDDRDEIHRRLAAVAPIMEVPLMT